MKKFIFQQLLKAHRYISCSSITLLCSRDDSVTTLEGESGTEIVTLSLSPNQETEERPQEHKTLDKDLQRPSLVNKTSKKKKNCPKKSLKITKKPVETEINLNKSAENLIDGFWCAVQIGDFEACKLFLDQQSDINIEYRGKNQETALHVASRLGHFNVCKLLLNQAASVNPKDVYGRTPLHLACKFDYIKIVLLLLKSEPDVNAQDDYGKTARDYAEYNGNDKIVATLNSYLIKLQMVCEDSQILTENKVSLLESKLSAVENLEDLSIADFKLLKVLGKGRFGKVFLASYKQSGQLFAIKILQKSKILSENLVNYTLSEKNILSRISHPFIAKLHYAFQSVEELYLVLTYYSGGTLGDYLKASKKFPEATVKFFICEIILALEELHSNSIVYRDLKPENILIDGNGHLVLSDFGLSKQGITDTDSTNSFCGSSAYMPPEILLQSGHNKSVDWYLLGVLMYELLSGSPPFYNPIRQNLAQNILTHTLHMPENISELCHDLLTNLLKRNPTDRIGYTKDAKEIKEHPYFSDICWSKVYNKANKSPITVKNVSTPLFVVNKPDLPSPTSSRHKFNWTYISP